MGRVDHNKEIAAAAKSVLAPLGCVRKGRSRTWLDDHGWWVGVIEFQPSGWSKGSYLNVGATYLWMPIGGVLMYQKSAQPKRYWFLALVLVGEFAALYAGALWLIGLAQRH